MHQENKESCNENPDVINEELGVESRSLPDIVINGSITSFTGTFELLFGCVTTFFISDSVRDSRPSGVGVIGDIVAPFRKSFFVLILFDAFIFFFDSFSCGNEFFRFRNNGVEIHRGRSCADSSV